MKALDLLNKYNKTAQDQSTSQMSMDLAVSGLALSPLQIAVKELMSRSIPTPMLGVARKFFPDLGKFLELLDKPEELHSIFSAFAKDLNFILRKDHEHLYTDGKSDCQCPEVAEGPGKETSAESVHSGNDRDGQVNSDGGTIQ